MMERRAARRLRHRLAPLAALCGLTASLGCAEREVWTGRRCAPTLHDCAPESGQHDAAAPSPGSVDAALPTSREGEGEPPPANPGDAGGLDACVDCVPRELPNARCVAGHYSGQVRARWIPAAAGLCGLVTLFGGEGSATLDFDLEAIGGEAFSVVGETCIDLAVVPDSGADDELLQGVERKMGMRGTLDCNTGEFKGEVRGTYNTVSFCDLGTTKNDYFFKGPMTARFDPSTRSFVSGLMVLREPRVTLAIGGEAGGEGTWSARLNPDAGKAPPRSDCLGGVRFPDELFPDAADASM